jgi:hypothetical protein
MAEGERAVVNATLNCTTEACPVIVDCTVRQKNVSETENAGLYISTMNWAVLTGFAVFGAFSIAASCLWNKSREVWAGGPPAVPAPAADAPPDVGEGEVLAPEA